MICFVYCFNLIDCCVLVGWGVYLFVLLYFKIALIVLDVVDCFTVFLV